MPMQSESPFGWCRRTRRPMLAATAASTVAKSLKMLSRASGGAISSDRQRFSSSRRWVGRGWASLGLLCVSVRGRGKGPCPDPPTCVPRSRLTINRSTEKGGKVGHGKTRTR
ncbi:m23.1 protein [Murid betaherpesvirus 1]|uniref:M23.1 protein n=1 Tax=Murid herpesvirus 1 TaxID=10366 RepID=H2A0R4_MUHV1|nr:m23.1 protein [Murid betaherpesvirus 1]